MEQLRPVAMPPMVWVAPAATDQDPELTTEEPASRQVYIPLNTRPVATTASGSTRAFVMEMLPASCVTVLVTVMPTGLLLSTVTPVAEYVTPAQWYEGSVADGGAVRVDSAAEQLAPLGMPVTAAEVAPALSVHDPLATVDPARVQL
jgi:hypothetical protein